MGCWGLWVADVRQLLGFCEDGCWVLRWHLLAFVAANMGFVVVGRVVAVMLGIGKENNDYFNKTENR